MANCTNCGAPLEPDAMFCVACGAKTNDTTTTPQSTSSTCPSCGAPLEPGAAFCVQCGATVSPSAPQPQKSPAHFAPTAMPSAGVSSCPRCGAPLEPDAAFCVQCGATISPASPAPSDSFAPSPTPSAGATSCPSCGAPLEPDAAFCVSCGAHIDNGAQAPVAQHFAPQQPAPVAPSPVAPISPNAGGIPSICPTCGAMLEPDADFCISCGKRVPGTERQGTELAPEEQDMRTQLVFLSREEAQNGCQKTIEIDGQQVSVVIPAGTNSGTDLDFPGYGYPNSRTGERGILRLNFFVD